MPHEPAEEAKSALLLQRKASMLSIDLFSATPFEGFDHRSLNLVTDPTSEVRSGFEADLAKMPVNKACGDDRIRIR